MIQALSAVYPGALGALASGPTPGRRTIDEENPARRLTPSHGRTIDT